MSVKSFLTSVFVFSSLLIGHAQNWKYFHVENTSKDQGATYFKKAVIDKKGNPWFVNPLNGGITYYNGTNFTNYTSYNGLPEDWIIDMAVRSKDELFILGYNHLSKLSNGTITYIDAPKEQCEHLLLDQDDNPIVFDNEGMWYYKSHIWKYLNIRTIMNGGLDFGISDVSVDADNRVWVASTYGIFSTLNSIHKVYDRSTGLKTNGIYRITCPFPGIVYFSYNNAGFGTIENSIVKHISRGDFITDFFGHDFNVNEDSTLTYIHKMYGLVHINPKTLAYQTIEDSLVQDFINGAISKAAKGNYWICTDKGVSNHKENEIIHYRKYTGLASNFINTLYSDKYGNVFVGTIAGLSKFDGKNWTYLSTGSVEDIIGNYPKGDICVGFDSKISQIKTDQPYAQQINLLNMAVNFKNAMDSSGNIWLITALHQVLKISDGKIDTFSLVPFDIKVNRLRSIAINPSDNLPYLATYQGVYVLKENQFVPLIGTESFLCLDINFTSKGELILYGNKEVFENSGIFKFVSGNLIQFTELNLMSNYRTDIYLYVDSRDLIWFGNIDGLYSQQKNGEWKHYSVNDGLKSNSIQCIEEDLNGNIWIATTAGLVTIPYVNVSNDYPEAHNKSFLYSLGNGEYSLSCVGNCDELKVYLFNSLGKSIYGGDIKPGETLSLQNLNPGIWYYQLVKKSNIFDSGKIFVKAY